MDLDGTLIAMVLGGIGLSIAYLTAEYLHWRAQGAADRHRETLQRELHAARLAKHEATHQSPSGRAATEKIADELPERRTAPAAARRVHPFVDRRQRASSRQSAGSSVGTNA